MISPHDKDRIICSELLKMCEILLCLYDNFSSSFFKQFSLTLTPPSQSDEKKSYKLAQAAFNHSMNCLGYW